MKILSIIVPVYNKENLLRECLESLSIHILKNELEVILIDDGSSDNSLVIMKEYEQKEPQIFNVYSQPNQGVGAVMNWGLKLATGKYVKEVDADDWVNSKALIALVDYLYTSNMDIVLNPFLSENEDTKEKTLFYFRNLRYNFPYTMEDILTRGNLSVQSCTIRKAILEEKGFELSKQRYYIDMQLIESAAMFAKTCVILRDSVYRYRVGQSEQSVNINNYVKHIDCFYEETFLSIERLQNARRNKLSKEKILYQKKQCLVYSVYLYGITALSSDKSLIQLDKEFLEKECELYEELGQYYFIQKFREDVKNGDENAYKQWLNKEYCLEVEKRAGNAGLDIFLKLRDGNKEINQVSNTLIRKQMHLLNRWIMNMEQGYTPEDFFRNVGCNKIAIYGLGMLGEHLYQQLKDSTIEIAYGIDNKLTSVPGLSEKHLQIKKVDESLDEVDAIVITTLKDIESIKKMLMQKMKCNIITIEDVLL